MITAVMTHAELPGIMAYFFDDGMCIVADPTGRESPAQPFAVEDFEELGWEVQEDDAVTQLSNVARGLLMEALQQLPRKDSRSS